MYNHSNQTNCVVGLTESWSLNPLMAEFGRSEHGLKLVSADRKDIIKGLSEQAFDLGLCPSSVLLYHQSLELAMPLGEAIRGPSGISYLVIYSDDGELIADIADRVDKLRSLFTLASNSDIRSWSEAVWSGCSRVSSRRTRIAPFLKWHSCSNSWSQLARLIYRLLFGQEAFDLNQMRQNQANTSDDQQGSYLELKCGDTAIYQRRKFQHTIDLSALWTSISGLPFVSTIAVKNKRKSFSPITKHALFTAADLAQAKMRVEPSSYLSDSSSSNFGGQLLDLSHLWRKVTYRLGGEEVKSLRLWMHLLRPLERHGLSDEVFHLEMVRWQQRDSDGSLYLG